MQEAEDLLAKIDELDAASLEAGLTKYEVKAPDSKNDISAPFPFNLMFRTSIGPKGDLIGYLRPETAQGIFVNFKCAPPPRFVLCLRCTSRLLMHIILLCCALHTTGPIHGFTSRPFPFYCSHLPQIVCIDAVRMYLHL
jgi:hypothetical protein